MSDYIRRILSSLFAKLFNKEKKPQLLRIEKIPSSRYATPLSSRSRVIVRDSDPISQHFHSYPTTKLQRIQKQLPMGRCSSETSRSSFVAVTPLRPSTVRVRQRSEPRNRPSNAGDRSFNLGDRPSNVGDRTFNLGDRPSNVGDWTFNLGDRPSNVGDRQSNLGERPPNHEDRPFHYVYVPATADMEIPKYQPASEFCSIAVPQSPKSSLEFCVPVDDWPLADGATGSPIRCDKPACTRKSFQLRANPFPQVVAHPCKWNASSKIPVRSRLRRKPVVESRMPQHHRGRYTMVAPRPKCNELNDSHRDEDMLGDYNRIPDLSNWIAYRNDTSFKFERVFKFLSKKKKHTIGNVIDSNSHTRWLQLAGISVDRDAAMFKQFAGGKVVLTFGEYKFLIDKISSFYDLDYWDVLRKMATFHEEDTYEVTGHLTPP